MLALQVQIKSDYWANRTSMSPRYAIMSMDNPAYTYQRNYARHLLKRTWIESKKNELSFIFTCFFFECLC